MRVSARLQATAAPEAPAPMMSTSTTASVGRALPCSSVAATSAPSSHITPHRRPVAHRVEQRPIALLHGMALRERCPCLQAKRLEHAVVAVVALQHGTPEGGD